MESVYAALGVPEAELVDPSVAPAPAPAPAEPAEVPSEPTASTSDDADEARAVQTGRLRRLTVIRYATLVAAAAGVATVVMPWWLTKIPPQTMRLTLDGRPQILELGEGTAVTTGLAGGQLTRVLIVAVAACAIWYAMGRLWWWVALLMLYFTQPALSLAPPSIPPVNRVGENSQLSGLTTDMAGLTLNRYAFYALVALALAAGYQAFRVRQANKDVDRAEGRAVGIWATKVLPKLAEAGISVKVEPKASHGTKP